MKVTIRFELPYEKADDFYKWLSTHPAFVNVFVGRI